MKNLYLLDTDKPSRLVLDSINNNLFLTTTKSFPSDIMKFKNIYITSDEEIKEGDWYLYTDIIGKLHVRQHLDKGVRKGDDGQKIILTTDQELISDSVQPIDDEFLEWFVNNTSCEEVEVKTYSKKIGVETDANGYREMDVLGKDYRLIIPKM